MHHVNFVQIFFFGVKPWFGSLLPYFFRVWGTWPVICAQEGGQFDVNYMEKSKKPTKVFEKRKTAKIMKKSTIFQKIYFLMNFFRICSYFLHFSGPIFYFFRGGAWCWPIRCREGSKSPPRASGVVKLKRMEPCVSPETQENALNPQNKIIDLLNWGPTTHFFSAYAWL